MQSSLMRVTRIAAATTLAAALLAGCTTQDPDRAEVESRGSDPAGATAPGGAPAAGQVVRAPAPTDDGIVQYEGYAAVRARDGDTVQTVADRIGLSAVELGAYNGLSPTQPLDGATELALPPRPDGYATRVAQSPADAPTAPLPAAPPPDPIETAPIASLAPAADGSLTEPSATAAPVSEPAADAWSPDLAAAAIDRATGLNPDGSLGRPPSATDPIPEAPGPTPTLRSPDLGQYQTPLPGSAAPPISLPDGTGSDTAATAPTALPRDPGTRLLRPVDGPVALRFREGAGTQKNDGVDFAAAAGAPVVAAEAGEVALVSEALGGLGTIVLVRHPNELLTVYGRLSGVTVQKGDLVARGQRIGAVAPPQGEGEARMHFEVREGATSVDPLGYI
ncbi:MAG: peptidoglycan DD-metalloendopeptidase family protein [Paracoccaceae bacterium]